MFDFTLLNNNLLLAQSTDNHVRDLLVALVAIGLGLNILYAVYTQNARCYEMGSVQILERNLGRNGASLVLCVLGGLCLLVGVHLVVQASGGQRKLVKTTWGQPSDLYSTLTAIK